MTTPLSGFSIPSDGDGMILVLLTSRMGLLGADTAPGASVRGSGSSMLWLGGSAAQVNAKLATLTYAARSLGIDDLSLTVLGNRGTLSAPMRAFIAVVPLASGVLSHDVISVDHGTLTLDTRLVDGPVIAVNEPIGSTNASTCILVNTTIGPHSTLSIRNDNDAGGVVPRLAIAGRVELAGSTRMVGNGAAVTLAAGANLVNSGSIAIGAHAAQFSGTGRLINDGVILLVGDASAGSPVRIDTEIAGAGSIRLSSGAVLSIGGSVAASETIAFDDGVSRLHLAKPAAFAGSIDGFVPGDTLVLDGLAADAAFYSRNAEANDGTLTLFQGQVAVASIRFGAVPPGSAFRLDADAAGSTTISLGPVPAAAKSTSVDVHRFFDAAHGTQLLTQDRVERDTIAATRPDLRYEGVGLHAVDPAAADTSSVAVYRFFDTATGTHFMTASAAERDAVLTSRPDLLFEPGSTMFEHAAAASDTVPVYRFFDRDTGAHFFTADAGERASIVSTRPDMALEGIAFYAPA